MNEYTWWLIPRIGVSPRRSRSLSSPSSPVPAPRTGRPSSQGRRSMRCAPSLWSPQSRSRTCSAGQSMFPLQPVPVIESLLIWDLPAGTIVNRAEEFYASNILKIITFDYHRNNSQLIFKLFRFEQFLLTSILFRANFIDEHCSESVMLYSWSKSVFNMEFQNVIRVISRKGSSDPEIFDDTVFRQWR